jgi:HEAT repeat protein
MLQELGPAAKPAVPDLIRILQTEKFNARTAVNAIGAIGPDAAAALPALHSAWTNSDKLFRYNVSGAIWSVGRETNAVLNFCMSELAGTNDGLWSVGMASQLDEGSRKTFAAALRHRLQDSAHPEARGDAAVGLGRMNIIDNATQRALLQGASDSDEEVRHDCAWALSKLCPTNAVFAALSIRAFLESADAQKPDDTLVNFVRYAHDTGVDLDVATAALKKCLNDDDPNVHAPAAKTLALLEPSKHCAVALSKLYPTNAAFDALSIRYSLEWTAQKPGATSADVVENIKYSWVDPNTAILALKEYLKDDDPKIRAQAAKALPLLTASKSSPID